MTTKRAFDSQFDLFVPFITDLPLRDQRETMERPFFSLSKRKRLKPIEYLSPSGEVFVNVSANPEFGMATIWDADVLIWAASVINNMRKAGTNDIPRTLHFHPYELLKTIGRETGGQQYRLLRDALGRLQATTIVTNIRKNQGKKHRQFSWIEGWTDLTDETSKQPRGMSLTLSEWFYEGILMDGGLLSIDPAYFSISGGRERWLYRVARKHAGGAGEAGFAIPISTLFEKSGAEGTYRRFKFELLAIVRQNGLPGISLSLEGSAATPSLRMVRRDRGGDAARGADDSTRITPRAATPKAAFTNQKPSLPLFRPALAEDTIAKVRAAFPGWDVYALKADFDAWLDEDASRQPRDYDAAFYGFVRRFDERERPKPTRS